MKKYLPFLVVTLFSALFLFSSCNKDNNDPPKTKRELLVQASWKFKSATVAGAPYNNFPSCQTDNILSFNNSGSGVADEGATKCNAGDPQTNPFTWSFQNADTEIQLSSALFTNGGTTITLISISETELVISFPVSTPGPIIIVQVTFQH